MKLNALYPGKGWEICAVHTLTPSGFGPRSVDSGSHCVTIGNGIIFLLRLPGLLPFAVDLPLGPELSKRNGEFPAGTNVGATDGK